MAVRSRLTSKRPAHRSDGLLPDDVLATYSVFLRYEMVRGELRPAHFDASMESLRTIIQDI